MAGMILVVANQSDSPLLTLPIFYQWLVEPAAMYTIETSCGFLARTRLGVYLGGLVNKREPSNEKMQNLQDMIEWAVSTYYNLARVELVLARIIQIFLGLLGASVAGLVYTGPGADLKPAWGYFLTLCAEGGITWFWLVRAFLWVLVLFPDYALSFLNRCQLHAVQLQLIQEMGDKIENFRQTEKEWHEVLQKREDLEEQWTATIKNIQSPHANYRSGDNNVVVDIASKVSVIQEHLEETHEMIEHASQQLEGTILRRQVVTKIRNEQLREREMAGW